MNIPSFIYYLHMYAFNYKYIYACVYVCMYVYICKNINTYK